MLSSLTKEQGLWFKFFLVTNNYITIVVVSWSQNIVRLGGEFGSNGKKKERNIDNVGEMHYASFTVQLANAKQLGDHYASKHPKEKPPTESE
uniref:Uncharacterized protein n=1 Tax=Cannabis sativa TaxID=3483 RepID=A0A803PKU9_CANSA